MRFYKLQSLLNPNHLHLTLPTTEQQVLLSVTFSKTATTVTQQHHEKVNARL